PPDEEAPPRWMGNGPRRAACLARLPPAIPSHQPLRLMDLLALLAVLLHVLFFGAWLGLGLRLAGVGRTAVAAEPAAGAALAADGSRTVGLMNVFVVLGYLFALVAFFLRGGFSAYTMPYHLALMLGLVLVAVQW